MRVRSFQIPHTFSGGTPGQLVVAPRSGGLSIARGKPVRRGPRSGYLIDKRCRFSTMWAFAIYQ